MPKYTRLFRSRGLRRSECAVTQCDCMGQPVLNKLLQYTWQCANLERNYNENAQNINCASILINPEIHGLAEPQSRDFGIPGFQP